MIPSRYRGQKRMQKEVNAVLKQIKSEIENQLLIGRILNSKDFDDGLKWCLEIIDRYENDISHTET